LTTVDRGKDFLYILSVKLFSVPLKLRVNEILF